MSQDFIEATIEVGTVNAAAFFITLSTAKWGEYIGEPGNIVSLCVAVTAVVFTIVRTTHYYLLIKDRNEQRRKQ